MLWDVDTIDWKPIRDGGPTAAQIVANVLAQAQGGSILLFAVQLESEVSLQLAAADGDARTTGRQKS